MKLNVQFTRMRLWLLIVLIYGAVVANKAVKEHDYVYDSKHYENVTNAMDKEYRKIYFEQKCNSMDLDVNIPEPLCYSLTTIDNGTMVFDIGTPQTTAQNIVKNYNDVAFKFIVILTVNFSIFFILLWLIPSVIFYPFCEWFIDGYKKEYKGELSGVANTSINYKTANKVESLTRSYFKFLEGKGKIFNAALGIGFTILFGVFDTLTPQRYSFIMIYMFPIALTTWFAGQTAGFVVAAISISFWAHTNPQTDLMAFAWNILSTVCIYFIVSVMLTKLRHMWEEEANLSRTDQLTGVMNRRAFEELAEYEIASLQRQGRPFSLAYIDLDNFKEVNDSCGHKKGDALLKSVAKCLKDNLRQTDLVARIGGDEFTIFLPATDLNAVVVVGQKLVDELRYLTDQNRWPTTVSMGIVTSVDSNCDLESAITLADKLMYDVKSSGKNDVAYLAVPLEVT